MQVSAKTPQMLGESIEVRAEGPSDFVRAQLRVVPPTASAPTADDKNEEETRAGLRRLAELVRDKRRSTASLMPVKSAVPTEVSPLAIAKPVSTESEPQQIDILVSYHLIPFILKWQERQRRKKTAADIVREDAHRLRGLRTYKRAAKRAPASIALSY